MKKSMKLVLGLAAAGVLLLGVANRDAVARTLGRMYGNSLHIENEPRSHTSGNFTLGNDDAYVRGRIEADGVIYADAGVVSASPLRGPTPTVQALAAGFTIAADACGGVKLVSATAVVTSDTTNTFTAAATAGKCDMLVVNSSTSHEILLDNNTEFPLAGGAASLRLAAGGSIRVWSDGTQWYHGAYTEY